MSTISAKLKQTPSERKRYVLDWDAQLSEGEIVLVIETTITSPTNAPVSPALVIDSITIGPTGRQAVFYASGGADVHTYEVQFFATTSIAQELEDIAQFDIAEKL